MMMDRDKVIKGLEHCISESEYIDDNPCKGCPYFVSDQYGCDRTQMEKDALELLKEQEMVKPYIDIDEAKCPICKVKLTRQELLGDNVLYEDFFDYCPHCGHPIDWGA